MGMNLTKLNQLKPRSKNQASFIDNIDNNDIVFGVGFPGSGKTVVSLKCAISALANGVVKKIVIIRPMVQNKFGDSMGFLPGDQYEKSWPHLGSIVDNLDLLLYEQDYRKLIDSRVIEAVPLSLIRGRSFNNAFVIIEEAQNIKGGTDGIFTILTRLGQNSKMVFTGDLKQSDVGGIHPSDLEEAINKLMYPTPLKGVGFTFFDDNADIQRNPLLYKIMERLGKL
jgi:phosphate starvation-inducible PhoH-like protein